MANNIVNKKIEKLFVKDGGTAQKPWTRYDIYLEGDERKFAFFGGKTKIIPVQGMNIAYMEFEVKQAGEYTNYNVTTLHSADEPKEANPAQGSNNKTWPKNDNKKFIDHGKCMIELMNMSTMDAGIIDKDRLKVNLGLFRWGCERMVAPIERAKPPDPKKQKQEPEPEYEEPPDWEPPDDEGDPNIPF